MQNTAEDISHAATGHKANLSNPNTSDASKAHSEEVLSSLPDDPHYGGKEPDAQNKNPGNVAGGLKAAINNPQVTEQGKAEAQKKLDAM
ncbi:hypothetical protein MMC06_002534 [Schaereria dolodes]|nr:hypothetical protein [Schaereria dolodes]